MYKVMLMTVMKFRIPNSIRGRAIGIPTLMKRNAIACPATMGTALIYQTIPSFSGATEFYFLIGDFHRPFFFLESPEFPNGHIFLKGREKKIRHLSLRGCVYSGVSQRKN